MIPEHVVTLVLVLAALFVLIRWGGVILFIYACLHFCAGEWLEAGIAFFLACFPEIVRAFSNWLDWNTDGRDAWLRQRTRARFHSSPRGETWL